MLSKKTLEEIVDKLVQSLPDGLQRGSEQCRTKMHEAVRGAVKRLDLVSREEFDAQAQVLKRCQEELKVLNEKLDDLQSEKSNI